MSFTALKTIIVVFPGQDPLHVRPCFGLQMGLVREIVADSWSLVYREVGDEHPSEKVTNTKACLGLDSKLRSENSTYTECRN